MKLIDADRIRYRDMSDGQVPGGLWYTFKDNVDKMPTVDAIPVEWLIKVMQAEISLWEQEKDTMFVKNGAVTVISHSFAANAIAAVIEKWRKEND